MSSNSTSAFIGDPPITQRDYYIVHGLYQQFGDGDKDPGGGFSWLASKPPNYVHETKSTQIIIGLVIIIMSILITTIPRVVLRATTPGMIFGSDDWAIIVAACVAVLYPVAQLLVVVVGGGGNHTWEVTYVQYSFFNYWAGASVTLYYVSVGLIKISITLFIRRMAHQTSTVWRIFCDVFLFTLVLYVLWALFSTTLCCVPIAAAWTIEIWGSSAEVPKCINRFANLEALSIVHVIQGVILLCSPIIMLWKVRMGLGKKIRLFATWAVGGITVLGGVLDMFLTSFSADVTWEYTGIITWAAIDICFGFLTASLPILDAFIVEAWDRMVSKVTPATSSKAELDDKTSPRANSVARCWTDTVPAAGNASVVALRSHPSESQEHFVKEDTRDVEMGIMRTTDVEVRYTTVQTPDSIDQGVINEQAVR